MKFTYESKPIILSCDEVDGEQGKRLSEAARKIKQGIERFATELQLEYPELTITDGYRPHPKANPQ